jgi:hypothetical protein
MIMWGSCLQVVEHERFFGFVESISGSLLELLGSLGASHYETKTRGTRTVGPCRCAGEGVGGAGPL